MNQSSMKRFHLEIWFRLKLSRIGVDIYFVVFTLCTLKEMIIRFFFPGSWNWTVKFIQAIPLTPTFTHLINQTKRTIWIGMADSFNPVIFYRLTLKSEQLTWKKDDQSINISKFWHLVSADRIQLFWNEGKKIKKKPSFSYLNSVELKKKAARVNISPKVQIFNRSIVEIWIRRFKLRWSK